MRCGFNLLLALLLFHCKIKNTSQNIFDPTTFAGGTAAVLSTLVSQDQVEISSRYQPTDYPAFIKTEILDLDLNRPIAKHFGKNHFRISDNYKDDLVIRDVFPLSETKLRLLFSVSSRSEWREPISIFIQKPESFDNYFFPGKVLEFKFPYPRYIGSISEAKGQITTILMSDGKILLVGGVSIFGNTVSTVEIFNPESGTSTLLPSLNQSLMGMAVCSDPQGNIYVSGGKTTRADPTLDSQISDKIYKINGTSHTVVEVPIPMLRRRVGHSMVCLSNGDLLISGGQFRVGSDENAISNDHEYISIQNGTSSFLGSSANFPVNTVFPSVEYDESKQRILFFGGKDRLAIYALYSKFIYSLDVNSKLFTTLPAVLPTSRSNVTSILVPGGDRLILGGVTGSGVGSRSIESWTEEGSITKTHGFTSRIKNGGSIVPFSNAQVLYTGGVDTYYKSGILELYDHIEKKNFIVDTMMEARSEHSAIQTTKGVVIFGDSALADTRVELYGKD
ncbi:kelch-like protein [Leptospira sp. 2 VSF19]|uniref:Kelch-like protein n=1 Tax=Leptospira soteropolitanensis TaxID=2950025 RepID=A0AAW5VGW8_9LEPT|nr:kelch motif-containing protein [Leptospira soteropolitanensis]MCW7492686.1 kelch-like protein [Leptospira soteropolitanensis]MCW7500369.1 kelch-like protein [Leptospira soteropolitanensis]MCW7522596.1 kelch-like protein [Leptospira soteropolitanensis]MCW7526452.1 kelch-like protein [Leptospira soteropolitanensis]MCW7530339.1 kelch-like protein [Leptospira soteropolitanensis]